MVMRDHVLVLLRRAVALGTTASLHVPYAELSRQFVSKQALDMVHQQSAAVLGDTRMDGFPGLTGHLLQEVRVGFCTCSVFAGSIVVVAVLWWQWVAKNYVRVCVEGWCVALLLLPPIVATPCRLQVLDLRPYINNSSLAVHESFSAERTYILFSTMGLRHLVVVDDHNRVKGIITRKDLMGYRLDGAAQRSRGERSALQMRPISPGEAVGLLQ